MSWSRVATRAVSSPSSLKAQYVSCTILPRAEVQSYKWQPRYYAAPHSPPPWFVNKSKGCLHSHFCPYIWSPFNRHYCLYHLCTLRVCCVPRCYLICTAWRQAAPCLCSTAHAVFCAPWFVELLLSCHARCLLSWLSSYQTGMLPAGGGTWPSSSGCWLWSFAMLLMLLMAQKFLMNSFSNKWIV